MKKLIFALALVFLALRLLPAAAQEGTRDKWGVRVEDWATQRVNPFLERLSFDWRGRKTELIEGVLANDGKAQLIMALGLYAEKIEWEEAPHPDNLLLWASDNGIGMADYLIASRMSYSTRERQTSEYLSRLERAVKVGYIPARQRLGMEYVRGLLVKQDLDKGLNLIQTTHPATQPISTYYLALSQLKYDRRNPDKEGALKMIKGLSAEGHEPSRAFMRLWDAQEQASKLLMNFEASYEYRGNITTYPNVHLSNWEACSSVWQLGRMQEPWSWDNVRISQVNEAGELKVEGVGPEYRFKPTRSDVAAQAPGIVKLVKTINASCAGFGYFRFEEGEDICVNGKAC